MAKEPKIYMYLFTRQDMSGEQQIVQTAHAAFKMGHVIGGGRLAKTINPDQTYFTVIGVRNLDALGAVMDILDKFDFLYETFFEADIGGEPTSIALYPISENDKGILLAFNLLTLPKK